MILHLDMDAFFASVEQADNPELRGKPVIIGTGSRAVASTCSYEARAFGVRSAMPLYKARRLCPHGIFLPGRMHRYKEISRTIFKLLHEFSPIIEKASIDECYLDITGTSRLFGPPARLARLMQQRVWETCNLTCSIGVAPVKFLAKIASDWHKPRGITIIETEQVAPFLAQLPVSKIPGVGRKTLPLLQRLGIVYASQVLDFSKQFWEDRLGKQGAVLYARAQGKDPGRVVTQTARKSCSAENTLAEDTSDPHLLRSWLLTQSRDVASQLRRMGVRGRTITLKIKFADFTAMTRSKTLAAPTRSSGIIFETASLLLESCSLGKQVRLIGVGVSQFAENTPGLPFLQDPRKAKLDKLDEAMDAIAKRFGESMVQSASLLTFQERTRD
ncbi:DNA polymerase IV [Desulfoplanes formicivorans]|uniref:DNA polymerase IV n=1 Tax=Desulfoplanes formicivorans TaxID=1592317 RepID=A0A194AJ31_9BACT|nr:DNA polymerase IV [Desulfoplanes formicivorans]GAU09338.1 DNA polymerase IV [Desulfoplanes formicivorans]